MIDIQAYNVSLLVKKMLRLGSLYKTSCCLCLTQCSWAICVCVCLCLCLCLCVCLCLCACPGYDSCFSLAGKWHLPRGKHARCLSWQLLIIYVITRTSRHKRPEADNSNVDLSTHTYKHNIYTHIYMNRPMALTQTHGGQSALSMCPVLQFHL